MKKTLCAIIACLTISATPLFAHHAAEGIVDEEVYEMIDTMIADTPHADMTLDDIAIGMTEMTITTRTIKSLEVMIDDGLLTYIAMLDGDVSLTIMFNDDNSVTMTVLQQE
ncbi:MAG: hypothetical protein KKG47_11940 [Proteobacteria bacterium]|nr:hypothetical protein [Pseudomonadota bacterium]MBU1737832.1 hypothetical protein [Pseudomonadota bacterium]